MSECVAGVLLAAGLSSRMGENKLLLELGGESVLRRSARTAIAAGLDPLLVVLGHESDRGRRALDGLACTIVINARYAKGMNTSLKAGIAAVPVSASAAVVLLADMPLVTEPMIRAVAAGRGSLALSVYGEIVAPPIRYARALFPELLALDDDRGGKRVVEAHRREAIEVRQPAGALLDLDEPADVERARRELGAA
jgi:molybdenum cofactor cytidylyltransferase